MLAAQNPFYPQGMHVKDYVDMDMPVPTLLTAFASGTGVIFAVSYLLAKRIRPSMGFADLSALSWFALCGSIHLFFEGYYAYNVTRMGPMQDLFGQLWKEYAKSDSRYMTVDGITWSIEAVTAVLWGPGCYYIAWSILARHPTRHPAQMIVSMGQLYGCVLYYATGFFNMYHHNLHVSRPEAQYFWIYFVAINSLWVIVPLLLVVQSAMVGTRAFRALDRLEKSFAANGSAKKAS